MSAFVDKNVLVRHLTGDPADMARRATRYLATEHRLLLSDLIVAEAYLVACAESTGVGRVASFDRAIDRVDTVERIEPAADW